MKSSYTYVESRFSEAAHMKDILSVVDWANNHFEQAGAPVCCALKDGKIFVSGRDTHTMIFGATGSKKTRCIVMVLLTVILYAGESVIVTDPKGELYQMIEPTLKQLKIPNYVLNFRKPETGNRYNLLEVPDRCYREGKEDAAIEMIKNILYTLYLPLSSNTTDLFWTSMAEEYATGLCQILMRHGIEGQTTFEGLAHLMAQGNKNVGGQPLIQRYLEMENGNNPLEYRNLQGTVSAPNETRASIYSVASQPLGNITCQNNLNDMMSASDFEVKDLGRSQMAVFIIVPDEKTTYNGLAAMFIKQSYELLVELAHQEGGRLPVRVNYLLEEAGNIPQIKDLGNMVTAARSREIRFHFVLQDYAQFEEKYGSIASSILGNCQLMFLHSKDRKLLEYISYLCGVYRSCYTGEERPLIPVSRLQRLSKEQGECLVLLERKYPFITKLADISEYSAFVTLGELPPVLPLRIRRRRELFDLEAYVKERMQKKVWPAASFPRQGAVPSARFNDEVEARVNRRMEELKRGEQND